MRSRRDRSCCAVPNCRSKAYKNPDLSFFKFPKAQYDKNGCLTRRGKFNIIRRRQWIIALRIGHQITDRSIVCAKHFHQSDMVLSGRKRARPHLKHTAVPCLSVPFVSTDKFRQIGIVAVSTKTWKKKDIIALISLYKEEKCLYDRKDSDYSRPVEQYNAYKRIKDKLFTNMYNDCTVSQIQSKLQALKNQYIVEKNCKDKSPLSGLHSKTANDSLWFFEHLRFLDDYLINEANSNFIKNISSEKESESLTSNSVSDNEDLKAASYDNRHKLDDAIVVYLRQKHVENGTDPANEQCESLASNSETYEEIKDREQDIKCQQHEILASNSETDEELEDREQDIEDQQCGSFASYSEIDEEFLSSCSHAIKQKINSNLSSTSASETESYSKKDDSLTNFCEREDTFGRYVASKMRLFRDNSLLYLQTEQSIVQVLNSAHLQKIKSN